MGTENQGMTFEQTILQGLQIVTVEAANLNSELSPTAGLMGYRALVTSVLDHEASWMTFRVYFFVKRTWPRRVIKEVFRLEIHLAHLANL